MKRFAWVMMTLISATGLFSQNVQAQTTNPIYFPYVVNDSQTSTELILTNLSRSAANVSLAGYREDGTAARASVPIHPAQGLGE